MADPAPVLSWSGRFTVADTPAARRLPGDKINLPQSALQKLLEAAPLVEDGVASLIVNDPDFDPYNLHTFAAQAHARKQTQFRQQQLPHPLTFRLVNAQNSRVVYAGIREFSADDETAEISPFVAKALGIDPQASSEITVHYGSLPKGTFVKLRPLEAGYDPEDWKSLLEEHLRKNYTTLSRGEVLSVPAGSESYEFLIDSFLPDGEAICVVDTDLEVDIEALNEDQARETLRKIAAKAKPGQGASSAGGDLKLFKPLQGQVQYGDFVDYQLPSWNRASWLEISVQPDDPEDELYLLASPHHDRQRARPRVDEHVFADLNPRGTKRLRLSPTNVELEDAESLWVAVHAPATQGHAIVDPVKFSIRVSLTDEAVNGVGTPIAHTDSNEQLCPNCRKPIPSQSLLLHEGFCRRHNVPCSKGCGQVFLKGSSEINSHWHCEHDTAWGNDASGFDQHTQIFHTAHACPSPLCNFKAPTLPALAQHRTSTCPGKLILCRFCHLVVPQEGDPDGAPNAEALLSGLTPHEVVDGGRTTECHLCTRIVRLRDLAVHLRNHDLERATRPRPRVCRNLVCGRTLDGTSKNGDTRAASRKGQGAGNEIGLCAACFGPLYVATHDPELKALRRRVERRYLQQLTGGCGRAWCRNTMCKTGRAHLAGGGQDQPALSTADALPIARPYVAGLLGGDAGSAPTPLHFCVDEPAQRRRVLAEALAAQPAHPGAKQYTLEWCVAALEAEGALERAAEWLKNFAPSTDDEAR